MPPLPTAPREARHALAKLLGADSATPAGQDSLVVLTELVTNGVVHDGGDDILVRTVESDHSIEIEVVTTPRARGADAYPRPNVDPVEGGRGMAIVSALCRDLEVHNDALGRRVVRCSIARE